MAKKATFLTLGITFLGFILRVVQLDYQSLRGDESFSVWFSSGSPGDILNLLASQEPHPPLYYLSLHYWMGIAGDSEFSVRFLSVAAGVLLIPVTFAIGRVLATALNGIWQTNGLTESNVSAQKESLLVASLASFLVAINPLLIWHSQDARMYSYLSLFAAASVLFCLRGLANRKELLIYCLVTYLALLSHYSSFYVIATEDIVVLLFLIWRRQHFLARAFRWFSAQALVTIAYLPWIYWTREVIFSHASDWVQPVGLSAFLERSFVALGAGTTITPESRAPVLLVVSILMTIAVFAVVRLASRKALTPLALAAGFLIGPMVLLYVFSLQRPMFDERHLVIIVPAFALMSAFGGVQVLRKAGPGAFLVALLFSGLAAISLNNYYLNPEFKKGSGWRALAAEIRKSEKETDFILLNYPDPTFAYYYRGQTPFSMLPGSVPLDKEQTEKDLILLTTSHERIWLIPVHAGNWDAEGFVEKWLDTHTKKLGEADFDGTRLELFAIDGS